MVGITTVMKDGNTSIRDEVRPLSAHDLPSIMSVQEVCYQPSLIEPAEALLSKMLLFPMGAWGCFCDGELAAYMICIPAEGIVPLGRPTNSLPSRPDRLYIHDLAVHLAHRGRCLATRLIVKAEDTASWFGHKHLALVSVQGTERFWSKQGFEPVHKMEYAPGLPATYMVKPLHNE